MIDIDSEKSQQRKGLPHSAMVEFGVFSEPHWIPFDEKMWPKEGATHWHTMCKQWYEGNKDRFLWQHADKAKNLHHKSLNAGYRLIEDDDAKASFKWSADDGAQPQWFKQVKVKVAQHTFKDRAFDSRCEVWAWRAQRCIVAQAAGCSVVVILPIEMASPHPDIGAWLATAHHAALEKCFSALLEPGDSVYCPLGTAPLFVPLPQDPETSTLAVPIEKGSKEKELSVEDSYVSMAVHIAFDAEADVQSSPEACRFAAASFVSASNWIPNSIRNSDAVKAWRASLESRAATESKAGVEAGG